MILIGLTGSIGMGKSTTASFFVERGIAVNDADRAVVHDLYQGEAVPAMSAVFPEAIRDGVVDRAILSQTLAKNPAKFKELEAVIHPMVRAREKSFIAEQTEAGADMVVLDIPLLFETGAQDRVDVIVVASCAPEIQRQRVLNRPGMTPEKFEMILARQVPDSQKRAHADFVVDTGIGFDDARRQVDEIIDAVKAGVETNNGAGS